MSEDHDHDHEEMILVEIDGEEHILVPLHGEGGDGHLHGDGSIWGEYTTILTDPAHLLTEITLEIVSYLIFGLVVGKLMIRRHDKKYHPGSHRH